MVNMLVNRIRDWIDAEDYRPILAAVLIVEIPVIAVLWILCAVLGAPWGVIPAAVCAGFLTVGWIILVVSALTRWLDR